jgi:phospholipid/cholesterol/gamma-HCH transport system substrate-binding protein
VNKFSTEFKVGIFAIIVIIILSYMTLKVGGLPMVWEKGYRLYVYFDDISGLDEKSRIKIAGVESGIVENISLEDGKARVILLINPDVKVYENAGVALRMSGLLGDRYLALTTGSPDRPLLSDGQMIKNVIPVADIDVLASEVTAAASYIGELARNLQEVFGKDERIALKEAILNLREVAVNLNGISEENREPLRSIIARLDEFTNTLSSKGPGLIDEMSEVARTFNEKGPQFMDDLSSMAMELKSMVEENRDAFNESIENMQTASIAASSIAEKIERGEGTLGKLVKDDKLYDSLSKVSEEVEKSLDVVGRLRTFIDVHTEYNTEESEWKGYFDLTLKPREDSYYILGLVSDPRGSVETTETTINGVSFTEEESKSRVEFSAQYGRRFDDLALRIGILENTFGAGADYFFDNDRGRIKADIWDFSADEVDADNAHARVGIDYTFFKYFFVSGGYDNFLNSDRRGIYIGGGLKFEDKDLKYLLGRTPNISLR